MVRIGFTGTHRGMTDLQKHEFRKLIAGCCGDEFHHGDCIGADAEAHDIACALGMTPVIHPPSNSSKRAFKEAERKATPLPYLDRNKLIVCETELLIATPREEQEQLRSGTWSTVRYARKLRRPVIIVRPDGSVIRERA